MVCSLTPDQIEDYIAAFSFYDKHQNGTIPTKYLICVIRSLGWNPTECEIDDYVNEYNLSRDGAFEFTVFLDIMSRKSVEMDEILLEAFYIFDSDGSGSVSTSEFKEVMTTQGAKMSKEELNELFEEFDENNDGFINLEEFAKVLLGGL